MRVRQMFALSIIAATVTAAMAAARTMQRAADRHDSNDPSAPGSVDHWPPVPRRPEE